MEWRETKVKWKNGIISSFDLINRKNELRNDLIEWDINIKLFAETAGNLSKNEKMISKIFILLWTDFHY